MLTSRSGSQASAAPTPPQSVEAIRRRARHRLIGAAVLVLLGVLGFPMLFDTQPRPIAVDIPIEIPARNEAPVGASAAASGSSSNMGAAAVAKATTAREGNATATATAAADSAPATGSKPTEPAPDAAKVPLASKPVAPGAAPANGVDGAAKADPKPVADANGAPGATTAGKTETASATATPAARAPAQPAAASKVEGAAGSSAAAATEGAAGAEGALRMIVQVGAFADVVRAREVRLKLERAGLKTYTHVAETPEGRRIRVRLGPFATRADAEKAAERAKALGLPAALLTL